MKASEILKQNANSQDVQRKLEAHLKEMEQARTVRAFESCGVCGGTLEFHHVVDQKAHKVQESGHCPDCRQKAPTRVYSLS